MLIEAGWLIGVRRAFSPHADARPVASTVDLIVVHNISLPPGEFGTGMIADLFLGQLDAAAVTRFPDLARARVSAHVLVERSGAATQFVSFDQRAWHAGASQWQGRARCNDFSIGIELEGTDTLPFTAAQYAVLEDIVRALWRSYPTLTPAAVVGHEHVAPGRKTDPGPAFDWPRLHAALGRRR